MAIAEERVVDLAAENDPRVEEAAPHRELVWLGGVLVFLASMAALYVARAFLLPLTITLLLAGILRPIVERLESLRLPRTLAAGMVVLATLGVFAAAISYLASPALTWAQRAPSAIPRIEHKLRALKQPLVELSRATDEMARLTRFKQANGTPMSPVGFDLVDFTQGAAMELATTLVLLFFVLASGDFFFRQLMALIRRPVVRQRAVGGALEVQRLISVYLVTVTAINFCLGAAASFALWLFGVPNPVLWGVMLGVLTYIPYLGPVVGHCIIAAVALVTLDDLWMAFAAPTSCMLLSVVEGQLVTPLVLGKSLALNPVVIFLALMFWTWLWGIPGAVIAVPIVMIGKIICDQIPALTPFGRLMARYDAV